MNVTLDTVLKEFGGERAHGKCVNASQNRGNHDEETGTEQCNQYQLAPNRHLDFEKQLSPDKLVNCRGGKKSLLCMFTGIGMAIIMISVETLRPRLIT